MGSWHGQQFSLFTNFYFPMPQFVIFKSSKSDLPPKSTSKHVVVSLWGWPQLKLWSLYFLYSHIYRKENIFLPGGRRITLWLDPEVKFYLLISGFFWLRDTMIPSSTSHNMLFGVLSTFSPPPLLNKTLIISFSAVNICILLTA